ncbi:hypothetical protein [Nodularia spumigena]|uniref:hypothetical protein n=1 Tax=Nodularia spumigena TaxID=70799 RepID=UPI00232C80FA|nr:hypothetical protein [Nodularia spumigena]MDB9318622.1 hypothetical protein [Nodularia spumigena CS-590/01A]MDB9327767.1 hypothetical protein [Nodularia spumigena CS-590/02]
MLTKYVARFSMILLLLIITYGCSNANSKFDKELNRLLNSSKSNDINKRHKKIFNELYGRDKSRQQGMEYCQLLTKGISKEEIRNNRILTELELITQGKVTPEKSTDIYIIDISIQLSAEKAYCPEHIDL